MPEVAGRILSRPVDQGDLVKKGDVAACSCCSFWRRSSSSPRKKTA
ncbi:MAG TPA: hypothetical protein VGR67_05980 [Candidatus Polarisedimenticolia bacterium]|nr:hypothetical protein [Candidatus Polarisedimenticolia bacterium]